MCACWPCACLHSYQSLADRACAMQLVTPEAEEKNNISYDFLSRNLLWHGALMDSMSFASYLLELHACHTRSLALHSL